jgi:hypothetical protein
MSIGFLRQVLWIAIVLPLVGCNSAPVGIAPPNFDPAANTRRALSDYDSNGDQKISPAELKDCAGLLSSIDKFDRDGDGLISSDELEAKLQEFEKQDAALVAVSCVVKRNNQPLEGALVKFEPESFLGETIKPATGTTASDGETSLSVADEELPEEYRGHVRGVHCGIYRVVVTHPSISIPAKYNTRTEIGRIVTRRDHDMLTIEF